MKLENQVQEFLNQLTEKELLIGNCESDLRLTATQEHILMLLSAESGLTNAEIAHKLNLSAAAVTKAVKRLTQDRLVSAEKETTDERKIALQLTENGLPIAREHAEHHDKTLAAYKKILSDFSADEQQIIARFLNALESVVL